MKLFYIIEFIGFYLWDLIIGAVKIAYDIITLKDKSSPGVVKFPLKAKTDFEIALLSNLITFSPGSMVIDIDKDRSHLYIHVMFLDNSENWKNNFQDHFEARVLRILR